GRRGRLPDRLRARGGGHARVARRARDGAGGAPPAGPNRGAARGATRARARVGAPLRDRGRADPRAPDLARARLARGAGGRGGAPGARRYSGLRGRPEVEKRRLDEPAARSPPAARDELGALERERSQAEAVALVRAARDALLALPAEIPLPELLPELPPPPTL